MLAHAVKPALGLGGQVEALEAPAGARLVEALPVPLHHDDRAAGPHRTRDPVEHLSRVGHVVKRQARHQRVRVRRQLGALELDAAVAVSLGGVGVDAERVVAFALEGRHEPAQGSAPELDDSRRRRRQVGANRRPDRLEPSLVGAHPRDANPSACHGFSPGRHG